MKTIYLVASGDLRASANQKCEAAQAAMEQQVIAAVEKLGGSVTRAHAYDPVKKHGFIDSQHRGRQVFKNVPKDAPLVVVEAVWQYSHHVLHGLRDHQGPILLVANFAGDFPGLVGMLNLHGSMVKANIKHSTLWSKDFTDEWARTKLAEWLNTGEIVHDTSHVRDLPALPDSEEKRLGEALAAQLKEDKAIIAVFDEYCMGMYNALIDDELMNPAGIYKEQGVAEAIKTFQSPTVLIASSKTSEDVIYKITKAIVEGRDEFGNVTSVMKGVTGADMAQNFGMPMHPGAEKYYKEAGLLKK